jgi:hypothetical protein
VWRLFVSLEMPNTIRSPLFELARVRVRFDYVASVIVNANDSIVREFRLDSLRTRRSTN